MVSSRTLVRFGVGCTLSGLVASDQYAPAQALYVQPAGLRPATPPSVAAQPQTMPAVQGPAAPEATVASPYFMMPATVDTTPQYLPQGMYATSESLPVAEGPASSFAFLGGFAGGIAAGAALVYSLVKSTGQKVSAEAERLELAVPTAPRRVVVNMSAAGAFHGQPKVKAFSARLNRQGSWRLSVSPLASTAARRTSTPKMEVGLLYSTTTGNTETVAGYVGAETGLEPVDIADKDGESVAAYDGLIIGAPTWHTGADTERSGTAWDEFIYGDLTSLDLSGKKVAIFGVGDSAGYADNFCDAMDELAECFKKQGAEIIGAVSTDTYEHEDSKSIADGKFVGLPCDEDNQSDMSEDRVKAWIEQIKGEGMPL